jgi:hypothetical protein
MRNLILILFGIFVTSTSAFATTVSVPVSEPSIVSLLAGGVAAAAIISRLHKRK